MREREARGPTSSSNSLPHSPHSLSHSLALPHSLPTPSLTHSPSPSLTHFFSPTHSLTHSPTITHSHTPCRYYCVHYIVVLRDEREGVCVSEWACALRWRTLPSTARRRCSRAARTKVALYLRPRRCLRPHPHYARLAGHKREHVHSVNTAHHLCYSPQSSMHLMVVTLMVCIVHSCGIECGL